MPDFTARALYAALESVPTDHTSIAMCIFAESELASFEAAFEAARAFDTSSPFPSNECREYK